MEAICQKKDLKQKAIKLGNSKMEYLIFSAMMFKLIGLQFMLNQETLPTTNQLSQNSKLFTDGPSSQPHTRRYTDQNRLNLFNTHNFSNSNMKTAQEILIDQAGYGFNGFTETFTSVHKQHFLRAMKIYANQKLNEAANKSYPDDGNGNEWVDKESILNLKDEI